MHLKGALLSSGISGGHFFFFLLIVFTKLLLDSLSKRGATCSLAQKGLEQFSPNNALFIEEVIIN